MTLQSLYNQLEALPSKSKKEALKLIKQILKNQKNADLNPEGNRPQPRKFGSLAGKIHIAEDFDATPDDFKPYV